MHYAGRIAGLCGTAFAFVIVAIGCAHETTDGLSVAHQYIDGGQLSDDAEDAPYDASLDAGQKIPAPFPDAAPLLDAALMVDAAAPCMTVPPSSTCGLVPQCGCPATQTCDVTNDTTGATACVAAGVVALGLACATTSNCARGLSCIFNVCHAYCPTAGQSCTAANMGICFAAELAPGKTTPNRNACTIHCDPMNSALACGTNGCNYFSFDRVTDCRPAGQKVQFQACTTTTDQCAAGFSCNLHPTRGKECEKWCRNNNDCGSPTRCNDVFGADAPLINGVKYGLCQS